MRNPGSEYAYTPLVVAAGELWTAATHARFLDAVADGSLPADAFRRWVAQDYLFARGLTGAQAATLARAPRSAFTPLIDGLAALALELDWFESHAEQLKLDLGAPQHPVCARYVDFLIAAAYTRPFPVLATILFGVEVAYLAAWSALEPAGPYAEFIGRWSSPHFAAYVRALHDLLGGRPDAAQQEAFNEVLRHEHDFWQMTWEG